MTYEDGVPTYDRPTITVFPLKENKVPIGFARDWPQQPKKSRTTARKKAKK